MTHTRADLLSRRASRLDLDTIPGEPIRDGANTGNYSSKGVWLGEQGPWRPSPA